ncbi:hypothetical protein ACFY2H_40540 [Streptomyces griseofuscus]|uniref:hypothetical protein n=1 Tax=Streptomyces griseofuscus TaxID=146922 RepID=UPI0036785737
MLIPGVGEIKLLKDISEAKRILESSRAVRAASGGFKYGVSPEEVAELNRSFGGSGSAVRGSIENTMLNAERYSSFYDKVAVVIRDVAGSHMYDDGNKRTTVAIVEKLFQDNNIANRSTGQELETIVLRASKGRDAGGLTSIASIAKALGKI